MSATPAASTLPRAGLGRRVTAQAARGVVVVLFLAALAPLVSLVATVVTRGLARLDWTFLTSSMRGVVGDGGGALHAIVGTLLVTAAAMVVSAPLGVAAAVYLVEYGRGTLARLLTFFVDVMTGIPSIVAGLFAYAIMSMVLGPGARSGLAGALALSVLMVPVVIRNSEEMLRLVPADLREAALALGSPVYRVILRVVLPTAAPGLVSGIMLGTCRIVGETAPLLLVAGFTDSMNYNIADGRLTTLPVFIYSQWQNAGQDRAAYEARAWAAALVLILIVFAMNLSARLWANRKARS